MATDMISMELNAAHPPAPRFARLLLGARMCCVCWLMLVGLWSAPAFGSMLAYPNALLAVDMLLAAVLLASARTGSVVRRRDYPFFIPTAGVLLLAVLAALARIVFYGTLPGDEGLRLWQHGEPLLRALLIFFAIAGHPRLVRIAWLSACCGMMLNVFAAIIQHVTGVSRWYADLDRGWADGWSPYRNDAGSPDGALIAPRAQGLTSYINTTGAMFAAFLPYWGVPFVLYPSRHAWIRFVVLAGAVLTAAGLWYTNSRGPMLALALVIIGLCFLLPWKWAVSLFVSLLAMLATMVMQSGRIALAAFLGAIALAILAQRRHLRYYLPVLFAIGLAGGLLTLDAFVLKYSISIRMVEQGVQDTARDLLYAEAWKTAVFSPWIGVGERQVAERILQMPHGGLRQLPRTQHNFHNQYLHWAAADGVPFALAMTLFTLGAVRWCWRAYRRGRSLMARTLCLSAALGMAVYLLCNLVDAHFWRMEGAGYFWSLLALSAAAARSDFPNSTADETSEKGDYSSSTN